MAAATAVALLVAGTALAAPSETARPRASAGTVTVERSGATQRVGPGTEFQTGDVVRVPSHQDQVTLEFADGSTVQLAGPATLKLVELEPAGRRVMLVSGVVAEAYVGGVALEIQTPYDASLVLQNATGWARVSPEDRVSFQRRDGDLAKVWSGGRSVDLVRDNAWSMSVRPGSAVAGVGRPGEPRAAALAGDVRQLPGGHAQFTLGERTITYKPANRFTREDLGGSVTRLCYRGDDFGVVYVGLDTVLFFADGDCVEFDQYGNVIEFSGISHIYHPLTDELLHDEPIENAADASISNTSRR